MEKIYLGDGAFAELTEYGELELTTEDGIRTTNRVVLDGSAIALLLAYMTRSIALLEFLKRAVKNAREDEA